MASINQKELKPITIVVKNIGSFPTDVIECLLALFNVYSTNIDLTDVDNSLKTRLENECLKNIEDIPVDKPLIWQSSLESFNINNFLFNKDKIVMNDLDSVTDITRINFHYLFAEYEWMTKFTRNRTAVENMLPIVAKQNLGHFKDVKTCETVEDVINLPIEYEVFEEKLDIENEYILSVFNDKELVMYEKDAEGNLQYFKYLPFKHELEDEEVDENGEEVELNEEEQFEKDVKDINDIIKNVIDAKSYELNFCVTKDNKIKVIDVHLQPVLKVPTILAMFETVCEYYFGSVPEDFEKVLKEFKK